MIEEGECMPRVPQHVDACEAYDDVAGLVGLPDVPDVPSLLPSVEARQVHGQAHGPLEVRRSPGHVHVLAPLAGASLEVAAAHGLVQRLLGLAVLAWAERKDSREEDVSSLDPARSSARVGTVCVCGR